MTTAATTQTTCPSWCTSHAGVDDEGIETHQSDPLQWSDGGHVRLERYGEDLAELSIRRAHNGVYSEADFEAAGEDLLMLATCLVELADRLRASNSSS